MNDDIKDALSCSIGCMIYLVLSGLFLAGAVAIIVLVIKWLGGLS